MYDRLPVHASPEAVVAALRDVLRERDLTEYAVVDHGQDMAAAGQPAYPAWMLIDGDFTEVLRGFATAASERV
jgi:hypothetical protein